MKVPVLSSLILLLGLSSHLPAIERPKSLDDGQPKERAAQSQVKEQGEDQLKEGDRKQEPDAIPQVAQQPGAWLGVLSEPVSETLGVHLDIEVGVVLDYVAPESPAAEAGLRQHDIVTRVGGRPVGDQDELREAIQAHDPGDEVTLEVVSKGEHVERKVKLGERPVAQPAVPRGGGDAGPGARARGGLNLEELENRFPDLRGLRDLEGLLPGGGDLQKQLDGHMRRLEKQLRDMERKGGGGLKLDFDLFNDLRKPRKGGAFNFNFKSSSSFKFFDDKGSVEMKTQDGGKEVVVRDKGAEILFEGPWDTEQDKAAAPEAIRERIERMNDGNRFHFRLENLPEPDLEIPEQRKPELE